MLWHRAVGKRTHATLWAGGAPNGAHSVVPVGGPSPMGLQTGLQKGL